jgi:Family of unknown function (DUF6186)
VSGAATSLACVVVLLVAALTLEVGAHRGRRTATAAQALGAAMRTTPGRATVLVVWLWLGVHFLAR